MALMTKEDVFDAIDEVNENRLEMLTEYWQTLIAEESEHTPAQIVRHTLDCAKMLYVAKAYQDTLNWLDAIGLELAKAYGEESDQYVAFIENEDLENLRMNALDKSSIEEEEEEEGFSGDDE